MTSCPELNPAGIVAFCDDLRVRAPKQTALAVRYFLEVASDPQHPVAHYHQAIVGEASYSHGNTVIRGLLAHHYLQTRQARGGGEETIDLAPKWKKLLSMTGANKKRSTRTMTVDITVDNQQDALYLTSPYNPYMPKLAKAIGGKWNGEAWVFPIREEERVRFICMDVYGEDGTPQDRLTVRCKATPSLLGEPAEYYFLAGRKIASTKGSDDGVSLGDGISIVQGGFEREEKNDRALARPKADTVFDIRNLPEIAANRLVEKSGGDTEILTEDRQRPASDHSAPEPGADNPAEAGTESANGDVLVMLRESLQEAREEILRLCETHGLPWPEESLAGYQRAIDRARVAEITRRG